MKIYYINSEEFLKQYDTEFLRNYAGNMEFKSVKRFTQYTIGRYLVKSVGERDYNITDTEIEIIDEKPHFKYSDIKFSITHCGKYIAAAFDTAECGLDIEEMKERDLDALSKRYKKEFNSVESFYEFWTEYEASIKLQQEVKGKYSTVFKNNYMLTVVSANPDFSQPSCLSCFTI